MIPQSIIDRAPSAELRDNQLDEDSLPPYSELDRVLEAYVELDRSREELLADGFDPDVVERALAMIDRAEYKRRQAPARREAPSEGVRPRPADADHEPLAGLKRPCRGLTPAMAELADRSRNARTSAAARRYGTAAFAG